MSLGEPSDNEATRGPVPSSVLQRLQQKAGSRLDVHLHDASDDSGVPVKVDDASKALRDPTGRYQVLGEIGRGGVGVVYKGRDQDLGRDVAMKVLRDEYASRPEIVERFVEEAQIGGQLQHPGIVPVYELGLQHGERPYFAMKLVKGETLAALLGRRRELSEDRRKLLGIFEQVCQTIAYAHARRVIHRDLKPHNVMLGSFGEVQVVDWGFAKVLQKGEPETRDGGREAKSASVIATVRSDPKKGTHSVIGSAMGTPAYMPPEQARGEVEHMDERSDVFGLGAMLCEILTGEPPYLEQDGDRLQQAARAELGAAYERIEQCGADAALVSLCKQCLSPAPPARPASGKQVADAITAWLTSVEERARQAQIHAAEAKVRARSTVLLSAAAVLLLGLSGGGYVYLQHEAQQRRDQATQRVAAALNEANVRLGEARSTTDLAAWTRAVDAAAQAERIAADPDVVAEQCARAHELLAAVREEHARAAAAAARLARDGVMHQRLLAARIPADDNVRGAGYGIREVRRRNAAYAAAFADYLDGADLTAMTTEQGAGALAGPLAVELAAALDHWVAGRRDLERSESEPTAAAAATTRLDEIARTIDADPWRNQLRALLGQPDPSSAALVQLANAADLRTLPVDSLYGLGMSLRTGAARDQARAVFEAARERFPDDFGCAFQLGLLHEEAEQWPAAAANYRVARALRPDMREVTHRLAMTIDSLGDSATAGRLFADLAAGDPRKAHWYWHLGVGQKKRGELDDAIATLRRAIELDPRYVPAHTDLGDALRKAGKLDEAIACHRRALELDARHADAHVNLGRTLDDQGDPAEAAASFRRAIEIDAKSSTAHNSLGTALRSQGMHQEALASYLRALELAPRDGGSHANLGLTLLSLNRVDEAIVSLQRAIDLDPKLAVAHGALAAAFTRQGRLSDAEASLRQALALDPGNATAHFNLGTMLENSGRTDQAIASYRSAAAIWSRGTGAKHVQKRAETMAVLRELEARVLPAEVLLAVARGERQAANAEELAASADLLRQRGECEFAVRIYERAFAMDARLLQTYPHRYDAACAAAFAGCGKGIDAAKLGDVERVARRDQAHRWLTGVIDHWRGRLVGTDADHARQMLARCLQDAWFAGLRGDAALAALPATEAEAWRALWQDLTAVLAPKDGK
jgi:serine/threonine-protein kinase